MFENGSELRKKKKAIGVSTMEIAIVADLHPQTVNRVFLNDGVSRNTVNRVRKALSQLQERLSFNSKAVG